MAILFNINQVKMNSACCISLSRCFHFAFSHTHTCASLCQEAGGLKNNIKPVCGPCNFNYQSESKSWKKFKL